jgi:hypothetical protein
LGEIFCIDRIDSVKGRFFKAFEEIRGSKSGRETAVDVEKDRQIKFLSKEYKNFEKKGREEPPF